jgi:hypothetical protein
VRNRLIYSNAVDSRVTILNADFRFLGSQTFGRVFTTFRDRLFLVAPGEPILVYSLNKSTCVLEIEKRLRSESFVNSVTKNGDTAQLFTNGVYLYGIRGADIWQLSLKSGSFRREKLMAGVLGRRHLFDSATTQFFMVRYRKPSFLANDVAFFRLTRPSKTVPDPLHLLHSYVYYVAFFEVKTKPTLSFDAVFTLLRAVVAAQVFPMIPMMMEALRIAFFSGSNVKLDVVEFVTENWPQLYRAGRLSALHFLSIAFLNLPVLMTVLHRIPFRHLCKASSCVSCIHSGCLFHMLSDKRIVEQIGGLFEKFDHVDAAFLVILAESLPSNIAGLDLLEGFIGVVRYSPSPLFGQFLQSLLHFVNSLRSENLHLFAGLVGRLVPDVERERGRFPRTLTASIDLFISGDKVEIMKSDPVLLVSADFPFASRISCRFKFEREVSSEMISIWIYLTKSKRIGHVTLPTCLTDVVSESFAARSVAIEIACSDHFELPFLCSVKAELPILAATPELIDLTVGDLYWLLVVEALDNSSGCVRQSLFDTAFHRIPKLSFVPLIRDYSGLVNEGHIPFLRMIAYSRDRAARPQDIFYLECALDFPKAIDPVKVVERWEELG